jgi:hypothetical protein
MMLGDVVGGFRVESKTQLVWPTEVVVASEEQAAQGGLPLGL